MDYLTLNDQLVAYRHRPRGGRTVVFANSLGSDQSLWDDVIAHLPRGLGTLTYDLRGHGASGLSTTSFDIDALGDDLIALIEALSLRDVVLCGVSVGGMIAQSVAAQRPDLCAAAILSNTAARIGTDARWNDRIALVENVGLPGMADAILETWFHAGFRDAHPARWAGYHRMLSRQEAKGYIAVCEAIRDSDLTDRTRGIAVPTLCVAGAADQSVPPNEVAALAALISGARMVTLDNVGHLPGLEAPARMADLIAEEARAEGSRAELGMAVRRAVLGDTHVDAAERNLTSTDAPFQDLITEAAWGRVWASDGISRRERSMLTVALLAATGNFAEIPMHVRACARTGATVADIGEALQHVAVYAGVPKANHALKLVKDTLAEGSDTA